MAHPTLILGGAPKCATSTVHRWLLAQPGVADAGRKEPFYLMDPGHPLANRKSDFAHGGLDGYAALFPDASVATHRVDATTHYLYQDTALRVIPRLPTSPKLLFLLREPALRAFSSFRFSQRTLAVVDPALDFTDFVDLVRARPERLHRHVRSPGSCYVLGRDLAYGRYVDYLVRFRDAMPAERLHVALTEDLARAPTATLERIACFADLTVDPSTFDTLGAENESFSVRHRALHSVARAASDFALAHPRLRSLLSVAYWRVQSRDAIGVPTEREQRTLSDLRDEYRDANARLADLFGLDLAPWGQATRHDVSARA